MTDKAKCDFCGQTFLTDTQHTGAETKCPKCKKSFVISRSQTAEEESATPKRDIYPYDGGFGLCRPRRAFQANTAKLPKAVAVLVSIIEACLLGALASIVVLGVVAVILKFSWHIWVFQWRIYAICVAVIVGLWLVASLTAKMTRKRFPYVGSPFEECWKDEGQKINGLCALCMRPIFRRRAIPEAMRFLEVMDSTSARLMVSGVAQEELREVMAAFVLYTMPEQMVTQVAAAKKLKSVVEDEEWDDVKEGAGSLIAISKGVTKEEVSEFFSPGGELLLHDYELCWCRRCQLAFCRRCVSRACRGSGSTGGDICPECLSDDCGPMGA